MERHSGAERPERETNAEWLADSIREEKTKPYLLINSEMPAFSLEAMKQLIGPRLPFGLDGTMLLCTTLQAIDDNKIPLKPSHRAKFKSGEPLYFVSISLPVLPERPHGRPEVVGMLAKTRDALNVGTALGVEVLRSVDDHREGRTLSPSIRRSEVIERIAADVAGNRFADSKDSEDRVFRFVQSAQRQGQGQGKLSEWHPGRSAGSVMKAAYKRLGGLIAGVFGRDRLAKLKEVEDAERTKLRTLADAHRRAKEIEDAQHEMSALMRAGGEMSLAQHQTLASAFDGGPALDELIEAAIGGRFNAALTYANFASYATEFAVAERLGRLSRYETIELHPMHCERLGRMLKQGANVADDADPEYRAARRVRGLALDLMPETAWWERIEASREYGLSHQLGCAPL